MDTLIFESIHHDDCELVEQRDSVRIIRINWASVRARETADTIDRIGEPKWISEN